MMENKTKKLVDTFIQKTSTSIFIFLLIIVTLAIIFKNPASRNNLVYQTKPTIAPPEAVQKVVSPAVKQAQKDSLNKAKFDLQGPLICDYANRDLTATAYIKSHLVLVKLKSKEEISKILLKGDCLYQWVDQQKSGTKSCGISPYLPLIDSLTKMNLFGGLDGLIGSMSQSGLASPISPPSVNNLLKSCVKKPVDDSLFVYPDNIRFIEKPLLK